MLTQRTQRIKDSLFANPRQVDLERATLYMQSYQQTEGEPAIIRRAKAFCHLLANHQIVLDGDDLLVGNRTATPRAGVVSPEMSPYWIMDELDKFPTRPQDQFQMSDQDKAYYRDALAPYWSGRSLNDWFSAHLDADVAAAQKDKVFAVAQTDKGQGHIIPDYEEVLRLGLGGIREQVAGCLAGAPDRPPSCAWTA